ncbi:DUF6443 domain-containing protein [Marinigracilibium pacificum]|uniref:DUF6443 domain-containing protein n=1 Tax=Marinigracilibium pacificum TaxID=2729599 RepID=A0A848IYB4_9BACT|nr:DUF6443 domain-containing protein [Marinigracilibium pacificum]NMM49493.1 hypothetical protein [Marinigracilibium pacificum]
MRAYKIFTTLFLLFTIADQTFSQCNLGNYNYSLTTIITKEGVDQTTDICSLSEYEKSVSITYYDGFNRAIQIIGWRSNPSGLDIIQPIKYNNLGLSPKSYLPYVSNSNDGSYQSNALNDNYTSSDQYQFYQNTTGDYATSISPFAESRFELSQRNTILEQGSVGEAWQLNNGNTIKSDVKFNKNDQVYLFKLNASDLPVIAKSYSSIADPELIKNIIQDENGHYVISFTNRRGQAILKRVQVAESVDLNTYNPIEWAETYSVYDDLGNVRFVLPPMATKAIIDGQAITQSFLDKWAFQYKYDNLNRVNKKKVPGSDWTYIVYDERDRVILAQDGNQRNPATGSPWWMFIKYDVFNRPVMTGKYEDNTHLTQESMQSYVNGLFGTSGYEWYEEYGGTLHGYTDKSFPKNVPQNEYLTVAYYDNYDFKGLSDFGSSYDYDATHLGSIESPFGTFSFPTSSFDRVKGSVTGMKRRVLGSSQWLHSVNYYDKKGRVIQVVSENQTGGKDKASNIFSYAGHLLKTYTEHNMNANQIGIVQRFDYDHAGRVLQAYHQVHQNGNWQEEVILSANEYNALGQVIEKNIHVVNGEPLQSVNYEYNIRGWLKKINDSERTDTNDLFGMEFMYNETVQGF